MTRIIRTTYTVVTPESAEVGDYAETGWIDEEGTAMEPDEYDREEGRTAVDLAVAFLEYAGASEPSSCPTWMPGTWYTSPTIQDRAHFEEGREEQHSFHLEGFSEAEEREIYRRLATGRAGR
jgi:hypothetical protein